MKAIRRVKIGRTGRDGERPVGAGTTGEKFPEFTVIIHPEEAAESPRCAASRAAASWEPEPVLDLETDLESEERPGGPS